jgi:4-diphosphocytidyl-2-C-methyl-D-erythritol kinase
MSAAARVQAQAKINLSLWVTPWVDPEGYHDILTVFQRIDLADDVQIRLGGTGRSLDVVGEAIPPQGLGPVEKNLAYRAADAYLLRNGGVLPRGFEIAIEKRIPVGGGREAAALTQPRCYALCRRSRPILSPPWNCTKSRHPLGQMFRS